MNVPWETNRLHRSTSFDSIPENFNTPAGVQLTRGSGHEHALGKTRRRSESSPPALGRQQAEFHMFPLFPLEIKELIYLAALDLEGGRNVEVLEKWVQLRYPNRPPKDAYLFVIGQKLPSLLATHREAREFLLKTKVFTYLFKTGAGRPPVLFDTKRDCLYLKPGSRAHRALLGLSLNDSKDLSFVEILRIKTQRLDREDGTGWLEQSLSYFPNLKQLAIELYPHSRRQRKGVMLELWFDGMAGNNDVVKIEFTSDGITYEDQAAIDAAVEHTDDVDYRLDIQRYGRRICNLLRNQLDLPRAQLLIPVHRQVDAASTIKEIDLTDGNHHGHSLIKYG
ncbi:hypothetical protein GLAREA_10327 [Glarea lozoyensis ATCC 20868]|uniref:2EXR domain-containing protein n=1 Tax=Glarea lozoyensis (strain ATCC 20868 / MF5171) TaxID=1116229 RepID=S3E8J5_GLAL2|nr:uncharacterized protein GLAREA_10327 [Glarea lozoyensis ATCC 20868]EPE34633.1 hypothetical protein GLAREA_10327 [Glarea lozoyensis ATCC 20868]